GPTRPDGGRGEPTAGGFETRMDVLERLGDVAVPDVPAAREFTAGVRRKLHPRLLALHVAEFAIGATAWGARHMLVALFAAVVFTATGAWPRGVKRLPPSDT
ncbi:MAG: hypothetical protein ACKOTB_09935, partial [Planctomycetia bacterium]